MAARQTGRGHGAQRGREAVAALGVGGLRRGALDEFAGRVLQEEACRPALLVADDLGGLVEGPRSVDAGEFEGAGAGQRGVGVEELEQGRYAVQYGGECGGRDRVVAERVRVQAPSEEPGAGLEVSHLAGEGLAKRGEVGTGRQVEAVGEFGAGRGVEVAVGQSGGDDGALEVEDGGGGVGERADLAVVAQGGDPAVGDGQGGGRQDVAGHRVEQTGREEDQGGAHCSSRGGRGEVW